jgi:hypothetical protein
MSSDTYGWQISETPLTPEVFVSTVMGKPALYHITPAIQHYKGLTMLCGAFTQSPFLGFVQRL